MWLIILYWFLILLMLVGIIGSVVPGIPGAMLILAATLIWGIAEGFSSVTWALGVAIFVLLLGMGVDFLAAYWGAKKAGASNWGQIGSIIGLFMGVFGLLPALPFGGPLLGILLGPLLGAFLGEFLYQRKLKLQPRIQQSFKAGLGIVVGSLVGNLIQGMLAIATVVVFIFTTWPPSAGI
ncbi:DUF456 family protein [Moorena sp. SIO4G3]|uniref:DUF456 domain-containing protein n=1 Tax=Moorena sp. SIO4G3 TaxID=2607821 RepID=UPI00142BBD14|nr:DUF456 family protein [Moorena sp. SIO4G3]NEO81496.1 DUF456 family protein [Moorena sp. SIO4G3]